MAKQRNTQAKRQRENEKKYRADRKRLKRADKKAGRDLPQVPVEQLPSETGRGEP